MNDIIPGLLGYDSNSPLLFTQFYFWAFFGVVLATLALIGKRIAMRNTFLCAASFFFYYKSSGIFVLLLAFTVLFCFFCGKWINNAKSPGKKKGALIAGLIVNLGLLAYFKYAYFFTNLINDLSGLHLKVWDAFAWIGNSVAGANLWDVDNILLPVGISFFIFQSISYLMDIYREKIKPLDNLLDFGFFVSFFPQLVAGPIVRANTFIPQLHQPFHLGRRQFGIAVFWILNGLAKKIILSDYIAVNFVDRVFTNPDMYSGFETLWALFGYSLQVYADFSGYTDIATGVAMLMGFYLPLNFNSPYKAPNPGNFWKRWHISLSQWLQHYLYIPLGGNREASFGTYCCIITIACIGALLSGSIWVAIIVAIVTVTISVVAVVKPDTRKKINTNLNRMNTMLLGGLWHGPSWNFMIWGGLNGLGMVVYEFWKKWDVYVRTLAIMLVTLLFLFLDYRYELPAYRIGLVWTSALFLGTFIRMLYNLFDGKKAHAKLEHVWAIAQTFVFITFTRLFFRSGSNLDPAEANKVAWNTTKTMVEQMATAWNSATIIDMLVAYRFVFGLIVVGLIIHWLPDHLKRWYRLNFALLPLPVMVLAVVAVVFIVYQFMTADLQAFIYFQF
ncbi:MAG: MBOAT family protein [Paludibacteraceae bacterium]|nr:MBOAT family protein [Paludibacteraceae bacterium]MBR6105368.1 MBOAT family protein [Paludibacteraceae bacterium]